MIRMSAAPSASYVCYFIVFSKSFGVPAPIITTPISCNIRSFLYLFLHCNNDISKDIATLIWLRCIHSKAQRGLSVLSFQAIRRVLIPSY